MTNTLTRPRFATLCSGIEAVSLAWSGIGFEPEPVFVADNAPFPIRFLKERFPKIPNLGDILTLDATPYRGKVDALWASFPCQDFSEAGKRRGMDGKRGSLTLAGIRIVDEIDPDIFCFENVEGLLSDPYNAFGQFLGALAGEYGALVPSGNRWTNAGYVLGPKRTIAWRTLDAQYFGLPQSRPRVYLVASPRTSGIDPRRVLLEQRSEGVTFGERGTGWPSAVPGADGRPHAFAIAIRGRSLSAGLVTVRGAQIEQGGTISNCLRASQGGSDKAFALIMDDDGNGWGVRQLLPVECERLQGMPDGWSLIPGASASQRYHAVGNSLAVPVVRMIGERIIQAWTERA